VSNELAKVLIVRGSNNASARGPKLRILKINNHNFQIQVASNFDFANATTSSAKHDEFAV